MSDERDKIKVEPGKIVMVDEEPVVDYFPVEVVVTVPKDPGEKTFTTAEAFVLAGNLLFEDWLSRGPDMIGDVSAFMDKFGLEKPTRPIALTPDVLKFRSTLHYEEANEYTAHAVGLEYELGLANINRDKVSHELAECLDACLDLAYVAIGTALAQFPEHVVREGWRRVQVANMSKVRSTAGHSTGRGSSHDVIKPPGFKPPDHSDLVSDHPYRET